MLAIDKEHVQLCELLLNKGANENQLSPVCDIDYTCIFYFDGYYEYF